MPRPPQSVGAEALCFHAVPQSLDPIRISQYGLNTANFSMDRSEMACGFANWASFPPQMSSFHVISVEIKRLTAIQFEQFHSEYVTAMSDGLCNVRQQSRIRCIQLTAGQCLSVAE